MVRLTRPPWNSQTYDGCSLAFTTLIGILNSLNTSFTLDEPIEARNIILADHSCPHRLKLIPRDFTYLASVAEYPLSLAVSDW